LKKKVLITGIRGFTGQHAKREFMQYGWDVYGLGRSPSDESDPTFLHADLMDIDSLVKALDQVKPDAVLNLAGIAFVHQKIPRILYEINQLGVRNLLTAMDEQNQKPSLLLASSAYVYNNKKGGVLTEDSPLLPVNDYGISKLAMEYSARLFMDKFPIMIARPFNYTGQGQDASFLIPKIISHFREKKSIIELGNLDTHRDYSDVRSVVQAYRLLLEQPQPGETFNVSSGTTYSLQDVLDLATSINHHPIKVQVNPEFVRKNEIKILCGDNTKLKNAIPDWKQYSLKETMEWMLES
jgi:nucleoside-diphosphate-sugar epimerase